MWQPERPQVRITDWRGQIVAQHAHPITRELWRLWLPGEPLPRYLRPPPAYRRW